MNNNELNKKTKLLFDGTILVNNLNKNSQRSGIFFVCYNLLKELAKYEDLDITIYYSNVLETDIDVLYNENIIPTNCKLIKKKFITNPILDFLLRLKKKATTENDSLIKKIIRFLTNKYIKLYNSYKNIFPHKQAFLKSYDIYFSPCHSIPKFITKSDSIKSYQLIHDLIPITMKEFYKDYEKYISGMETILKKINTKDKYFSVSNHTKKDILKHINSTIENNITVTLLGANELFNRNENSDLKKSILKKYNLPEDKKIFLSLCTIEPRKNLEFSINNFIEFTKKYNTEDCIFVVAGGAWKDYLNKFNQFIKDLKTQNKIYIINYVEDEDLAILYSCATAFVYPSLYEGFGMPVLEAMQCGCPVITSNTSSLPEVIGGCGIVIDPLNNIEMVKAYQKIYFNSDFRENCSKRGLERAKTFSWKKCANIMYMEFTKNETTI